MSVTKSAFGGLRIEGDRCKDRDDVKWAHPALAGGIWSFPQEGGIVQELIDPSVPIEKKLEDRETFLEATRQGAIATQDPLIDEQVETVDYSVPGLNPGDPDIALKVYVPRDRRDGETLPVVFHCCGGALLMTEPLTFPVREQARDNHAMVVAPLYRTAIDAPYPAAIDDLHAAYRFVVDKAADLGVDSDNIAIYGASTGGGLACALAFRLKAAGYRPRGVVAVAPIVDNRSVFDSDFYHASAWDSEQLHFSYLLWMSPQDYVSPFIGPEAFANRASVEDCRGLCPIFIHTYEFDPQRDACYDFASKLYAAEVYTELHEWAGSNHGALTLADKSIPCAARFQRVIDENLSDLMRYDLRRPWTEQ